MRLLCFLAAIACSILPFAALASLQDDMRPTGIGNDNVAGATSVDEKTFLSTAETYLIGFVAMVAVGIFIWIGYNMLTASGDPDQFKKAQQALTYAIIGLAIIPLAYALVKLVVSINF